jgi:hypothetical protein
MKFVTKYQPPNVYGSVEIQMFITSKNSTLTWCTILPTFAMKIAI